MNDTTVREILEEAYACAHQEAINEGTRTFLQELRVKQAFQECVQAAGGDLSDPGVYAGALAAVSIIPSGSGFVVPLALDVVAHTILHGIARAWHDATTAPVVGEVGTDVPTPAHA